MERLDFDSIEEMLKLSMVPISSTLSMILGKQVQMSGIRVYVSSLEDAVETVPCPGIAAGTQLVKGKEKSTQMFFFSEQLARTAAGLVMGTDNTQQELDDIMLSTIKEVIAQSLESSTEAVSEFLGFELKEELLGLIRVRDTGQMENWCDSEEMKDFLMAEWQMDITDTVNGTIYGIIPVMVLRLLGIGIAGERTDSLGDQAAPYQSRRARSVKVKEVCFPEFKTRELDNLVDRIDEKRSTIQEVSLGVSVEVGTVECTVQEILDLKEGQVLMLDKQAGSPADIMVNGEFIAKGDVFVMGDKFAARVTEIVNKKG